MNCHSHKLIPDHNGTAICTNIKGYHGRHHAKRSLMAWVSVIAKEGWARVAAPILLSVWHWLFKKKKKSKSKSTHQKKKKSKRSVSYQKKDGRGHDTNWGHLGPFCVTTPILLLAKVNVIAQVFYDISEADFTFCYKTWGHKTSQ